MISKYHKILGISENANEKEIKKAYRQLAKEYHPDINKSADSHELFLEISEAYELLIHHNKDQLINASTFNQVRKNESSEEQSSYNTYRQEARRKAEEQARMRYEMFKKQHEAFQESGLYDIGLIIRYVFRLFVLSFPFWIICLTIHCFLIDKVGYYLPFLVIAWISNGILIYYLIKNRKEYFRIGSFYYSVYDIKRIFTEKKPGSQKCFYCVGERADSIPFKTEFLKLKDIKLKTSGPRQHNINYKNDYAKVEIPRSRKAVRIHTLNSIIKVLSIILCLLVLEFESKLWRMVAGIVLGIIITQIILLFTRTRSNTSYAISYIFLIRVFVWISLLILASDFQLETISISPKPYMQVFIAGILFLDCFLEQFLKALFGKGIIKPLTRQPKEIIEKYEDGYQLYNEIPIWTVVFPIYKWVFG